jgi:hypothetical protein
LRTRRVIRYSEAVINVPNRKEQENLPLHDGQKRDLGLFSFIYICLHAAVSQLTH